MSKTNLNYDSCSRGKNPRPCIFKKKIDVVLFTITNNRTNKSPTLHIKANKL